MRSNVSLFCDVHGLKMWHLFQNTHENAFFSDVCHNWIYQMLLLLLLWLAHCKLQHKKPLLCLTSLQYVTNYIPLNSIVRFVFRFFTLWIWRLFLSPNFMNKNVEASVFEKLCEKCRSFCVLFINSNRSHSFTHTNWLWMFCSVVLRTRWFVSRVLRHIFPSVKKKTSVLMVWVSVILRSFLLHLYGLMRF